MKDISEWKNRPKICVFQAPLSGTPSHHLFSSHIHTPRAAAGRGETPPRYRGGTGATFWKRHSSIFFDRKLLKIVFLCNKGRKKVKEYVLWPKHFPWAKIKKTGADFAPPRGSPVPLVNPTYEFQNSIHAFYVKTFQQRPQLIKSHPVLHWESWAWRMFRCFTESQKWPQKDQMRPLTQAGLSKPGA